MFSEHCLWNSNEDVLLVPPYRRALLHINYAQCWDCGSLSGLLQLADMYKIYNMF